MNNNMNSSFHLHGYNITTDLSFQHERLGIPPELIKRYPELSLEVWDKKNKKIIPRLITLISKYPQSPQLKNFLAVAYNVKGDYKKAIEANDRVLAEHPDYLFGKLNLAFQYIAEDEPQKIPGLLGETLELNELYPERDLFHLGEVTGFYKLVIHYYATIKNLELAENRLAILQDIAPDHPDTKSSEVFLYPLRLEKSLERRREEEAANIKVTSLRPIPSPGKETPPVFIHEEINNLYQYGLNIPHEKLKEILALPRETVISDLEKVLSDAIDRYPYFMEMSYGEQTDSFPLHAICLLGELRAVNSLPAILDFLENDEEVLEFWFGDHLNATLWQPVYLLSQDNLELLAQFLLKPGIYNGAKTIVTDTLAQIVLHHPEKRKEIIKIFLQVLSYFNQADLKDNIIDSDFLGLAIGNIIDCGLTELLPLVKELYEKKYVSLQVNGTYEDVVEYLKKPAARDLERSIENIFDLYENILTTWAGYNEDEQYDDLFMDDEFEDLQIRAPATSFKIGRNDPCPCGSGKKYKKCCIDKIPLL